MKDLVSNRRVSILAGAAVLTILWAVFVFASGRPWTGLVWLGPLALLLVSSVVLLLGTTPSTSLATVIQGVDDEPTKGRKP